MAPSLKRVWRRSTFGDMLARRLGAAGRTIRQTDSIRGDGAITVLQLGRALAALSLAPTRLILPTEHFVEAPPGWMKDGLLQRRAPGHAIGPLPATIGRPRESVSG